MASRSAAMTSFAGPSQLARRTTFAASTLTCSRCLSTTSTRLAAPGEGSSRNYGSRESGGRTQRRRTALPPFEEWVVSRDAENFKVPRPGPGPNWIGDTPFPLNPSFNPPPPVHSRLRDELWQLHVQDPKTNSVRELSAKYNISLDRTLAILRLKALEKEMVAEGKPLQTEFQRNMDRLLGATSRNLAESDPAVEVPSSAPRPPVLEDIPESVPNFSSTLKPALEKAGFASAQQRKGLPTGGPDPRYEMKSKTAKAPAARPSLKVVEVGGKSYSGAGRVERNVRRAKKRAAVKKQQKAAAQASAKISARGKK